MSFMWGVYLIRGTIRYLAGSDLESRPELEWLNDSLGRYFDYEKDFEFVCDPVRDEI